MKSKLIQIAALLHHSTDKKIKIYYTFCFIIAWKNLQILNNIENREWSIFIRNLSRGCLTLWMKIEQKVGIFDRLGFWYFRTMLKNYRKVIYRNISHNGTVTRLFLFRTSSRRCLTVQHLMNILVRWLARIRARPARFRGWPPILVAPWSIARFLSSTYVTLILFMTENTKLLNKII